MQPNHKVWIDFDRRVPMRDGVTLSADVYRPQATAATRSSCTARPT